MQVTELESLRFLGKRIFQNRASPIVVYNVTQPLLPLRGLWSLPLSPGW